MPIVQVNLMEGRTLDQKRKLVAGITQVVVDTCGAPPEAVTVILNDMSGENYGKAGVLWMDLPPRQPAK